MPKILFDKENQPKDRPPRGKGWRQKILDAFEKQGKTEQDFIEYICGRAFNPDDPLASQLLREILQRLDPQTKATYPMVKFEMPKNATYAEKMTAVVNAAADGDLSADVAGMFVNMLKTSVDVEEVTELTARLERLEQLLAKHNGS